MSGKARTPAISSGTAHALKAKALNFGPQLPVVAQTKVRGLLAYTMIFLDLCILQAPHPERGLTLEGKEIDRYSGHQC